MAGRTPPTPPSDSFDQDRARPGLSLVGTVVCVFGVVGARAAQVQKAEASLQAEVLLDAGSRAAAVAAAVAVAVGAAGGGVVQFLLCTFCPVAYNTGEGQ